MAYLHEQYSYTPQNMTTRTYTFEQVYKMYKMYKTEKKKRKDVQKENNYLMAKLKIHESTSNKGEKDEVLLLIELFHMNDTDQYDKLVDIFGEEASKGIDILCMNTRHAITNIHKLSKAIGQYKADCMIRMNQTNNVYAISIKSMNCSNPAILNHTPRSSKVFQENGILSGFVKSIDVVLAENINKRKTHTIHEDVSLNQLSSTMDKTIQSDLIHVLSYFMFDGSGSGYSRCKSNSILEYSKDTIRFIKCCTPKDKLDYVTKIYDRFILSLRDKGMPQIICEHCKPWVFEDHTSHTCSRTHTIKYKGSLHIRMK